MRKTPDRTKILEEYAAFVGIFFLVGCTIIFIASSYLNRGSFQYFLSFHGADAPASYANSIWPEGFGDHYFGDYLLSHWWSQFDSPWFNESASNGPINNYLPFAVAIFWLFSLFPYWLGFVFFLLTPLTVLFRTIWKSINFWDTPKKTTFFVTGILFTFPVISVIDRGNLQIYVIAALTLSVYLFNSGNSTYGAIALGFAIALKGYPIFLVALWIHARRWKDVLVAAVTSISLTLIPLFFYDGGVIRNLSRVIRNIRLWEETYAGNSLAYNQSLKGTFLTLSKIGPPGIKEFFDLLNNHSFFIFLLLFAISCIAISIKDITQQEIVLIAAGLMSTSVGFVGGYVFGVYLIFIIAVAMTSSQKNNYSGRLILICLAIQMMPKGLPIDFWETLPAGDKPTYASLLGGIASLVIILGASGSPILRKLRPRNQIMEQTVSSD
jgi:hypothetical protein